MVLSISNFAVSAEQKQGLDKCFEARALVLSLCCSIQGYREAPLTTKNFIYDKIMAEVLGWESRLKGIGSPGVLSA